MSWFYFKTIDCDLPRCPRLVGCLCWSVLGITDPIFKIYRFKCTRVPRAGSVAIFAKISMCEAACTSAGRSLCVPLSTRKSIDFNDKENRNCAQTGPAPFTGTVLTWHFQLWEEFVRNFLCCCALSKRALLWFFFKKTMNIGVRLLAPVLIEHFHEQPGKIDSRNIDC